MFASTSLKEPEIAAARDLFDRIVKAEESTLTEQQRADPRAYLLATWHEAAEAVMRPILRRIELEKKLYLLDPSDPDNVYHPTDDPF